MLVLLTIGKCASAVHVTPAHGPALLADLPQLQALVLLVAAALSLLQDLLLQAKYLSISAAATSLDDAAALRRQDHNTDESFCALIVCFVKLQAHCCHARSVVYVRSCNSFCSNSSWRTGSMSMLGDEAT